MTTDIEFTKAGRVMYKDTLPHGGLSMPAHIAIKCRIMRGGFSGERIVTVHCADGSDRKGLAPTHYCWNLEKKPLGINEPNDGNSIEGFVAARQLKEIGNDGFVVEIPDGEMMVVTKSSIIQRPPSEIATNVSV
jgi:hypothetical protein